MSDDAKTVPSRPLPPSRALPPTRVLSGIQPTGRFHWGNYFGAIRQYIELQSVGESYYFIADLHALTTVREPERLRAFVRDAALDLVALGLDPVHAALFVQSDVPEVTELTWLLMTVRRWASSNAAMPSRTKNRAAWRPMRGCLPTPS